MRPRRRELRYTSERLLPGVLSASHHAAISPGRGAKWTADVRLLLENSLFRSPMLGLAGHVHHHVLSLRVGDGGTDGVIEAFGRDSLGRVGARLRLQRLVRVLEHGDHYYPEQGRDGAYPAQCLPGPLEGHPRTRHDDVGPRLTGDAQGPFVVGDLPNHRHAPVRV